MISLHCFKTMQIAAISLLISSLLSACHVENENIKPKQSLQLPIARARLVDLQTEISVPGSVVSDDRVELSSRIVGFIQNLDAQEGQTVVKGQLLVQIDSSDVNDAIRQAQAALEAAGHDLEDATSDVGKYETLAQTGAIASDTLRKAKVRRDIAQSAREKASSALETAKSQRAYSEIRSPVDGVVIARHKQKGDMALVGAPIITIESRRLLIFKAFISEKHIATLSKDMATKVNIDALSRDVDGRILRIIPSGDKATRRYEVDIALPQDSSLLPGMFGRATIPIGSESTITVPLRAMVNRGGLDGVFVAGQDNLARFRWLRIGRTMNGYVAVTAGLSEEERIILDVNDNIKDGTLVDPINEGEDNG